MTVGNGGMMTMVAIKARMVQSWGLAILSTKRMRMMIVMTVSHCINKIVIDNTISVVRSGR